MKQGIQTNFPHEVLRNEGCYFFCLMEWASQILKRDFTNEQIIYLYDLALEKGYIRRDCTILFGSELLNLAILEHRFTTCKPVLKQPEVPICVAYLVKPKYSHFLLMSDNIIWDPLDPNRAAAKDYRVESYRVIA
jgi:hypothetical protein